MHQVHVSSPSLCCERAAYNSRRGRKKALGSISVHVLCIFVGSPRAETARNPEKNRALWTIQVTICRDTHAYTLNSLTFNNIRCWSLIAFTGGGVREDMAG